MRISFLKFIILGEAASRNLGFRRSATLGIAAICAATGLTAVADTQQIPLVVGTNSIAFQLVPTNAQPAAVFGTLGAAFIEAWTFNNATKQWTFFRNPSLPEAGNANGLAGLAMGPIVPGQGYVVRMATAGSPLIVSGNPPASLSVTIHPGMNLIGFPITANQEGVGLQDLLNSPQFSFKAAFSWLSGTYGSFTDNGLLDDTIFRYSAGQALWVESNEAAAVVWTPSAILAKPIVYFERGDPIVIETPIAGEAIGTASQQLNIRVSRPYIGPLNFIVSGSAHPGSDFTIPTVTATNSIGSISGNQTGNALVPLIVSFPQKSKIQTNASVLVTLRRPAETPAMSDSASLPQVAAIKITDGRNGIYEGFIRGTSQTATLNGQNVRVALRSNGRAIIEPADGGLIPSRFAFAYSLVEGVPQFSSAPQSITLPSSSALGRNVTLTVTPGVTVNLATGTAAVPAFEVPLTLQFDGLIAGAPFSTSAKLTLTQADPPL